MAKINSIQVQKHLDGVNAPVSQGDLMTAAGQNGADDEVRAALDGPPDGPFETPADVLGDHGDR